MTHVLQNAILMVTGWHVIGFFSKRVEAIDGGMRTPLNLENASSPRVSVHSPAILGSALAKIIIAVVFMAFNVKSIYVPTKETE